MRKTESSSGRAASKALLVAVALLAYPVLIHLSLAFDRPVIIAGVWMLVSVVGTAMAIRNASVLPLLFFGVILVAAVLLWLLGEAVDLMYLPPVLINATLLAVFARTLLPGATPLVSRVASLWRGELDDAVAGYTRRVTIAWVVFFAAMTIESIALAMLAPIHVWSLFTNLLNYLMVLLFFAVEYLLRFYFLPNHEHLGLRDFCRLLLSIDLRRLAG